MSHIDEPTHYTGRGGIEPIDFIQSNDMDFLEGNVIKYVYRAPFKNGLDDLLKAEQYLKVKIQQVRDRATA